MLLGEQWRPAVLSLQIFCFFGLARTLTEPAGNVFMAIGKSKVLSMTNLLNFIILIIFIYPATTQYGIEGVSFLIVMMLFSHMIILWWFMTKNLDVTYGDIGETFRGPLLSSILMLIAMILVKSLFGVGLVSFAVTVIVGAFVYLVIVYAYDHEKIKYYWRELNKVLARTP